MEPSYDIQLHVQAILKDDDGQDFYDETDFYYKGVEVTLRGTEDISDITSVNDFPYVFDCKTAPKMRDDVEEFVGGGELVELWVDFY